MTVEQVLEERMIAHFPSPFFYKARLMAKTPCGLYPSLSHMLKSELSGIFCA